MDKRIVLPEDILYVIWKKYYTTYIVSEITKQWETVYGCNREYFTNKSFGSGEGYYIAYYILNYLNSFHPEYMLLESGISGTLFKDYINSLSDNKIWFWTKEINIRLDSDSEIKLDDILEGLISLFNRVKINVNKRQIKVKLSKNSIKNMKWYASQSNIKILWKVLDFKIDKTHSYFVNKEKNQVSYHYYTNERDISIERLYKDYIPWLLFIP